MAQQRIPPPQQGMSPYDYYQQLTGMGIGAYDAYQATSGAFGPPKSPQQQAADQAAANSRMNLAAQAGQIGGVVGGAALARYALSGNTPPASAVNQSGTLGISRAVPPVTVDGSGAGTINLNGGGATPEVIGIDGDVATIKLPNGQTDTLPKEALNDPGFMSDIDWGKVGQGALGAYQLYQSYNAFKDKDYAGGSIYGVAGGTNVAASGLAGSAAETAAGEALGGYLVPGANILVGAYGGYKTAQMIGDTAAGSQRNRNAALGGAGSGAAIGAGVGSIVPGVGTAIGAGIGAVVGTTAGLVGSWTGSHKGKAQFMRDNIRGVLQENNVLDKDYNGTLADGSTYDFGKDGSTLKWKNIDKIAEAQPTAWNAAVPMADALAASYGFVGQKASDIAAWYSKGAVSNAGDDANIARANMQHFAKQQGITMDLIKGRLDEAIKDNRINQSQYDYYMSGANQLLGGSSATAQQQPVQPPKTGEVQRVSPGMYMNDQGQVKPARTVRDALEAFYQQGK